MLQTRPYRAGTSNSSGLRRSDALQTDLGGIGAELVEGNFLITPAGNGLADIALAL